MDNRLFRVKTPSGYYYATGNGRYGRTEGTKEAAWLLCKRHADAMVEFFRRVGSEEYAKDVDTEEHTAQRGQMCDQCRIEHKKMWSRR